MANIGATTAFYKVETSLTRANSEVSKSMERLATGKANANAGDRSSYVAMADTFRLDFVGTKAGIKGASVTMGYLETGMRVLDSASALLSRLQELAVLGANDTNTTADHEAINLEAEAIGDEFNRLMTTSTYKGRDVFNTTAGSLYVSMGGRDQEMTFGIGTINYGALYGTGANERTIVAATSTLDGPNKDAKFNLAHLPSDAVVIRENGLQAGGALKTKADKMEANKTYVIHALPAANELTYNGSTGGAGGAAEIAKNIFDTANVTVARRDGTAVVAANDMETGDVITVGATEIAASKLTGTTTTLRFKEVNTSDNAFKAGHEYEIVSLNGVSGLVATAGTNDASAIARAVTGIGNGDTLVAGQKFTVDATLSSTQLAHINSLSEGMTFRMTTDT